MDKINYIGSKFHAGDYVDAEFFEKQVELKELKELYDFQKEEVMTIMEEEVAK